MSERKEPGLISHSCNHCGNCCKRRGELSLTPLDVYRISTYLNMTPPEFIKRYCDIYESFDVQIRTTDLEKTCIFFEYDRNSRGFCKIYDVRPMSCYLYPLKTRSEKINSFSIDSAAHCPSSTKKVSFEEFVENNSNGRYTEDFEHYKKFCMAVGTFYSDRNSPSKAEMFELLFYNNSAEELKQKLDNYLFG